MPTINQLVKRGRVKPKVRNKVPALEASHQNNQFIDTSTFQNSAQAQRILNKVNLDEISKAQPIVDWQIEQTIQRIYNRQRRAEVQGTR